VPCFRIEPQSKPEGYSEIPLLVVAVQPAPVSIAGAQRAVLARDLVRGAANLCDAESLTYPAPSCPWRAGPHAVGLGGSRIGSQGQAGKQVR
jgi:hypothetical protein